jgi:hypothetical protein
VLVDPEKGVNKILPSHKEKLVDNNEKKSDMIKNIVHTASHDHG